MQIRHCTIKSNVDNSSMTIIDPLQIRHVVIKGGCISSLSGLIDPKSHLNLDYPLHMVNKCVIAEKFEVGAKVEMSDEGLTFARLMTTDYQHYGKYNYTQNLKEMIEAVNKIRGIKNDDIIGKK